MAKLTAFEIALAKGDILSLKHMLKLQDNSQFD